MKKQSGFTLIELMVVMAIIAILATAGLTAYSNYLKKARDNTRLQVARQLMTTVESLSGGGPVPTAAALTAFIASEGFAYTLPTINPIIARISGTIDQVLGTAFAVDIDPMSGAGTCIDEGGGVFVLCGFAYATFSDGSYIISYGIEHLDSINNFWSIVSLNNYGSPVPRLFGNIIGTNAYITQANTASYYDTDEVLQALAPGVTITDGTILSDTSAFVISN